MKQRAFSFPSATGVGTIRAERYEPDDGRFDGVMVIHHGMAEHRKRYRRFIEFLCDHGIAVYMHDMASHGESRQEGGERGWFGEKDGWKGLIADYREMVRRAGKENPGKPIIALGHSMGSFLVRMYLADGGKDGIRCAIIMGTGGPNPAAAAGKTLAGMIGAVRGKKHQSRLINTMAFGAYGKNFEGRTDFDWLTRDQGIVDQYIADPDCGYLFTVQGMHALISVNLASNQDSWYQAVPKDLPILLISGEQDPVGDYGKGVRTVGQKLKESGHTRVTVKLYPEARHEVLNELNRDEVAHYILDWIKEEIRC